MAEYRLIALSNPVSGQEEAYNDWYDNQHLSDVLDVPGFFRAQRMTMESPVPGRPAEYKYMTIYDFVSDDLDRTFAHFFSLTNTDKMPISPAMAPGATFHVVKLAGEPVLREAPTPWPA